MCIYFFLFSVIDLLKCTNLLNDNWISYYSALREGPDGSRKLQNQLTVI